MKSLIEQIGSTLRQEKNLDPVAKDSLLKLLVESYEAALQQQEAELVTAAEAELKALGYTLKEEKVIRLTKKA